MIVLVILGLQVSGAMAAIGGFIARERPKLGWALLLTALVLGGAVSYAAGSLS